MIDEPIFFEAMGCNSDKQLAMAIDDKDAGAGGLEKLLIDCTLLTVRIDELRIIQGCKRASEAFT